jgi:hypothetical protein
MTNIAISIANAQIQCGIRTTPLDYIQEAMNTGLMEVVYNWARNMVRPLISLRPVFCSLTLLVFRLNLHADRCP